MKHTQTQFGLIGKKLGHSFSPAYFSTKFQKERIEAQYKNYELNSIEALPALIKQVQGLKGLNVTIPYKQTVIPFLDKLSPEARAIGAVNTILIDDAGKLTGYNTDISGFQKSLEQAWQGDNLEQAIVLGTGGAAQAVLYVLSQKLGLKRPLVVSRNPKGGQIGYPDLNMLRPEDFDVVINTTPLGMSPNLDQAPDFPYHILGKQHLVYDLIYNPSETLFMKEASQQGAKTENGMTMLIGQAEAAWELWQHGTKD